MAPYTPIALLRSSSSVNVAVRSESDAGTKAAAPAPWTNRPAIREAGSQAMPARADPTANTTRPASKTRLRP
jgi:hypothetical protein